MQYKVKRAKTIHVGWHRPVKTEMPVPKLVTPWNVVDEQGRVYCSEATRELAEKHIPLLEAADKRNEKALQDQALLEASRGDMR